VKTNTRGKTNRTKKMESCWSYVLSGQPESDDKQQEILGTLSTSVLFDKFVSFPTPSAERRERFQLYLVRELCVPAQSSAAVVHWLEFAYLGNLSTFAPASWILAAASVPFSKALRDAVLLVSGVRALDVLETWTRVWLSVEVTGHTYHTDHTDHTDHMTLRDAVASAFHVSVDLLAALDEHVLRVLETWLTGAAREYCASDASRSWYQSSEARDRCFDALGLWMRGEWACAMPGTHASRIMPFVKPVPLVDLLRFEDAIGVCSCRKHFHRLSVFRRSCHLPPAAWTCLMGNRAWLLEQGLLCEAPWTRFVLAAAESALVAATDPLFLIIDFCDTPSEPRFAKILKLAEEWLQPVATFVPRTG
jgi:hypothetical protein